MRHTILTSTLLMLSTIPWASAAETNVSDIRLIIGTTLSDDTEFEDRGTSTKIDTELDESVRIGLRYVSSVGTLGKRGGLIWGAGLFINGQEGEITNSSTRVTLDVTGIEGMIGYGLPIGDLPLHIEAGVVASVGTAEVAFKSAGGDSDDSGGYYDLGLEVGAYYVVAEHWIFGLDFRYLFAGETSFHDNATTIDVTVADHLEIGLSAGYRF
jgi:hypothetical protein